MTEGRAVGHPVPDPDRPPAMLPPPTPDPDSPPAMLPPTSPDPDSPPAHAAPPSPDPVCVAASSVSTRSSCILLPHRTYT